MSLCGVITRNIISYLLNELCDFDLIDDNPELIKQNKSEQNLGNQFLDIEPYC